MKQPVLIVYDETKANFSSLSPSQMGSIHSLEVGLSYMV